jgi:predicted permease
MFTDDGKFWLRVLARISDGVSETSVEQILGGVLRNTPSPLLAADGYLPNLRLLPGDRGAQPVRSERARLLYFLLGVVGFVLLIACVNLAGLTLARGVARQREIAVRRALGVSRLRLIRQMLLEGLVVSVTGTALGLMLTVVGRGFLRDLLTGSVGSGAFGNVEMNLALDPLVVGVGAGLAVVATLAFGLLPALRLSGLDPSVWLKPQGAGSNSPKLTVGRVLIAGQIALSVPLVVGAALLLRTMNNLGAVELGFDPRGIVVFQLDPGYTDYESQQYGNLYLELMTRLEQVPGVRSVTVLENALMSGIVSNSRIEVDEKELLLYQNAVGPGYLETLGAKLLAGRMPGVQDNRDAPRVAAVNRTAVLELFGGESPIGRILHVGNQDIQIIGVVEDTPYRSLKDPIPPTMYASALQRNGFGGHHIVMRTNASVARLEPAVREAVYRVHPDLPVPALRMQTDIMAATGARERVFTQLLTLFGAFALLLASIGLYGVTAYTVTRRTSEIGVRVAVGARSPQILWLILRQVAILAGLGLLVGVPLSLALGPLLGSLLFGVAPSDPMTVALSGLTMVGVALAAGFLPALRASRLDALLALRTD